MHWEFYSKNIYTSQKRGGDPQVVVSNMKNQIINHFEKNKTSLQDSIDILQYWRYQLKTELNAFNDDEFFTAQSGFCIAKNKCRNGLHATLKPQNADIKFDSNNFPSKKEKVKALLAYKKEYFSKHYKNDYSSDMFMKEKIELLEKMLLENLSTVRHKHANRLAKQQTK